MSSRLGVEVFVNIPGNCRDPKNRLGLVAAASSTDRNLVSVANRLYEHPAINLTTLFGPEHGLRGAAQAGEKVGEAVDPELGLPVYSLYGQSYRPTAEMLRNLDTLIIDLPNGGVRFYTFLSTL